MSTRSRSRAFTERLTQEITLLETAATRRCEVIKGTKTIEKTVYQAIIVKRMPLSPKKFGVTSTDILFLLPPEYPKLPPVGCYLNYKWPTHDHHFTLQSHYGAPFLREQGWYWYCLGLGGEFGDVSPATWRPARSPENGHNLATLFISAKYGINQD